MAGTTLNDRKKAASVRSLSLDLIEGYLRGDDEDYKKQLLLRLAGTALPRLTEVTGEDGGPLSISLVTYASNTAIPLPTETVPTTPTESTG